jgi:hypothetical protein
VGLSIDQKDVALNTKGAKIDVLSIQSSRPVSIKYSDPNNIPITEVDE